MEEHEQNYIRDNTTRLARVTLYRVQLLSKFREIGILDDEDIQIIERLADRMGDIVAMTEFYRIILTKTCTYNQLTEALRTNIQTGAAAILDQIPNPPNHLNPQIPLNTLNPINPPIPFNPPNPLNTLNPINPPIPFNPPNPLNPPNQVQESQHAVIVRPVQAVAPAPVQQVQQENSDSSGNYQYKRTDSEDSTATNDTEGTYPGYDLR